MGQKQGGDFAKFCDLLRIYELYEIIPTFCLKKHLPSLGGTAKNDPENEPHWSITAFADEESIFSVFSKLNSVFSSISRALKVSKFQKQILLFSFEPKKQ